MKNRTIRLQVEKLARLQAKLDRRIQKMLMTRQFLDEEIQRGIMLRLQAEQHEPVKLEGPNDAVHTA